MFKKIFLYELRYWLTQPSTYIYFLVFFGIAFLSFAGTAGFFDGPSTSTEKQRFLNSPHEINYMLQYFGKFFLFLLPAIIGTSVFKDYKHNVHTILYSFPIEKKDYLLGKFWSALLVVCSITLAVALGGAIGEHLPNLDTAKLGAFNSMGYLQAYLVYVLPNMLIYGAIIFCLVLWTRNSYAGFVGVLLLFFLQIILENAFTGNGYLLALFDPFGQNTARYLTYLWTLEEQNTQLIPIQGVVLQNRLLWFSIAAFISGITYFKFSLHQNSMFAGFRKGSSKSFAKKKLGGSGKVKLPEVAYEFSFAQQLKNAWRLSNFHFQGIIKNWLFLILLIFGLFAVLFAIAKVTNLEEMSLLPVTHIVLTVPAFFFTLIIMLLTFIYSGMLVHKERSAGIHQLVDTTAVPNGTLLLSKTLAILKMQVVLLAIMMLAGILIQLYNGFFQFQIGLYLFHLFGLVFLNLIIWAFISILVHSLLPNAYIGMFALILFWMGTSNLGQLGIDTRLLAFNNVPQLHYSDVNGYGGNLAAYLLIESYWFAFACLLLVGAYLFWMRGMPHSFRERLLVAKRRVSPQLAMLAGLFSVAFIGLGFVIFKEEMKSPADSIRKAAFTAFEKQFAAYTGIEQPKITDIKLDIDLYPEDNRFEASGQYLIVNKTDKAIDTILLKTGFDETTSFELNRVNHIIDSDEYVHFYAIQLETPLQPNDSLQLNFRMQSKENTLFERNSDILDNGTFLRYDIFPRLGYFLEETTKDPSHSGACRHNAQGISADFVRINTIISTSDEQLAFAPGHLKKQEAKEDRIYYHYEMNTPVEFGFHFNSGAYNVKRIESKGGQLEVYYQEGHEHNLDNMLEGMKASLDYNTQYFSDFQHEEARMIEFPHSEGSLATIAVNSISTSEIRFIANTDILEDKIDIAFYVASHELTHHWWGGQVLPADAFGAVMLAESTTEYVTLRTYERYYGKAKALQFLKKQRERYLRGRSRETEEEQPLMLVKRPQQYIAYGKGAFAFNSISQYAGEEALNAILKDFFLAHRMKAAPYATSIELVEKLKTELPDSLTYLVEDLFETVTFYENAISDAKVEPLADGRYAIELDFSMRKYRNEMATENLPLADFIEIAIYDEAEIELQLKRYKVTQVENKYRIIVDEKPASVVLDPNYLLLDKEMEDNAFGL